MIKVKVKIMYVSEFSILSISDIVYVYDLNDPGILTRFIVE